MTISLKTILRLLPLLALFFGACATAPHRYQPRAAITVKPDSRELTTNITASRNQAQKVVKRLQTAKAAIDRAATTAQKIEAQGTVAGSPEARQLRLVIATVQTEVGEGEKEQEVLKDAIIKMGAQIAALNTQIEAKERESEIMREERNTMAGQIDKLADWNARLQQTVDTQRGWFWKIGAFVGGLALLAVIWVALKLFRPTLLSAIIAAVASFLHKPFT